jgi:hypothetical protein
MTPHINKDGMLEFDVTRKSIISGKVRTKSFKVYPEDLLRYHEGALIQNAFPYLSDDDREFFMTGITPEEWDEKFNNE